MKLSNYPTFLVTLVSFFFFFFPSPRVWLLQRTVKCLVGDGTSTARYVSYIYWLNSATVIIKFSSPILLDAAWSGWFHRPQHSFWSSCTRLSAKKCCMWLVAHTTVGRNTILTARKLRYQEWMTILLGLDSGSLCPFCIFHIYILSSCVFISSTMFINFYLRAPMWELAFINSWSYLFQQLTTILITPRVCTQTINICNNTIHSQT